MNDIHYVDDHAEILLLGRNGSMKAVAKIDLEDVPRVSRISWCFHQNGYVVNSLTETQLHRFIVGAQKGDRVYHLNEDKLDCRRSNLRVGAAQRPLAPCKPSHTWSKNPCVKVGNTYRVSLMKAGVEEAVTVVDASDIDFVRLHRWTLKSDGYAQTSSKGLRTLHRALLQPPPGLEVDHINGDKLDNRRANLRIVTHAQNCQNVPSQRGNEHRNVHWHPQRNKWRVQINHMNKRIHGGYYTDVQEAVEAARKLRAQVFTHHNEDRH